MGELGCVGQHSEETGGPRLALEGLRLGQPIPLAFASRTLCLFSWKTGGTLAQCDFRLGQTESHAQQAR
jgi:hypothetical protein